MNADSLKSELQQVLDNDLSLRKEFTELKRSLSDYRNQLIMRDEDCKRLQVTIDVLNTKLAVMERDNTAYKAELATFRELRGSIDAQLEEKQREIDARMEEILQLREELASLSAHYESATQQLRENHESELGRIRDAHESELSELKSNGQYREAGIRDEYEKRIQSLTNGWNEKESVLVQNHEEVVRTLTQSHEMEVALLKEQHEAEVSGLTTDRTEIQDELRNSYETQLQSLRDNHASEIQSLKESHESQLTALQNELEEQRQNLGAQFEANIEALSAELNSREASLRAGYEEQINDLNHRVAEVTAELTAGFESRFAAITAAHDEAMRASTTDYEARIAELINEYEAKLSNTLIHSTSQNSKLHDELEKSRLDSERTGEAMNELQSAVAIKDEALTSAQSQIEALEAQLRSEAERFLSMETEFETFKKNALLSNDEKVNELSNQIVTLNQNHSEYVAELCTRIDDLNSEVRNLGSLFEGASNQLGETESALESKKAELEALSAELAAARQTIETQTAEAESYKSELYAETDAKLRERELEFQKLLAENTNLIIDIDRAQDKIEAQDAELDLLRTELQELKMISAGKTQDFKEILAAKNFELTSLEASNAALKAELQIQKDASAKLEETVRELSAQAELGRVAMENAERLQSENTVLLAELAEVQNGVWTLNIHIQDLNNRLAVAEAEVANLREQNATQVSSLETGKSALERQLETLHDEKISLLDEKEQMAVQLLKMNEVIGALSQQVDGQQIDVDNLNNHRRNVILAGNSGGNADNSRVKKQINELVREIDKCIALLSA